MIAAWLLVALLVYLGLGAFVESGFRLARPMRNGVQPPLPWPRAPRPSVEQVRDERLDIEPALKREVGR